MALVGPVLVTARSAEAGPTVLVVPPALLVGSGSSVPEVTVAVLAITVPPGVEDSGLTTTVNVAVWPDSIEAFVHDRSPPPLTGGVVQDQPVGAMERANVVPAGTLSLTTVLVAVLGPPLVATIV